MVVSGSQRIAKCIFLTQKMHRMLFGGQQLNKNSKCKSYHSTILCSRRGGGKLCIFKSKKLKKAVET
jgi:hypothetical protein